MFGLVGVIGGVGIVWLIGEDEVRAGLAGTAGVWVELAGVIGVETGLIGVAEVGTGLIGAVGMFCVFGVVGEAGVF